MRERKSGPGWPPPLEITKAHGRAFLLGLGVLVVGYLLLSVGPWDNPVSRTIAPLVLLFAYAVIFPAAIIWKRRKDETGRFRK